MDSERPGETNVDDPGWAPALAGIHKPWKRQPNGILAFRQVYSALVVAGFLMLYVLRFITSKVGRIDPAFAGIVIVLGIVGIAGAHWALRKPLNLESAAAAAATYRQNFFIGFPLAEAPLLAGFFLVFVDYELWPFLLAMPFWLVGIFLLAPTKGDLRHRQEQIIAQGSTIDLVSALRETPITHS